MVAFILAALWVLTIASGFSFTMFLIFEGFDILTAVSGASTIGLAYVTSLLQSHRNWERRFWEADKREAAALARYDK